MFLGHLDSLVLTRLGDVVFNGLYRPFRLGGLVMLARPGMVIEGSDFSYFPVVQYHKPTSE